MSLTGRYLIDRMKRALPRFRLPVPPYHLPSYWEGVYRSLGPDDSFEWGRISSSDLFQYSYTQYNSKDGYQNDDSLWRSLIATSTSYTSSGVAFKTTTLGETLNVYPNATKDEPILMLGCGNSELGPDMIHTGNWRGPILMVDVSARVVESMSLRHAELISSGDLQFIQDDATILSAFGENQVSAVLDKGLVDAVFCADDLQSCWKVLQSVHRVLQPGGCFVCLSFSRPEFLLERMLQPDASSRKKHESTNSALLDASKRLQWFRKAWENVEVRQLDRILLYRFRKTRNDSLNIRKTRRVQR
ncbi:hypothetical protein MPSEU_000969500 [Mayamaea pseudoterrestris]|nr:hypothetical protein MPSEU_000969500 [Mayamaea pseudoterrestris]